MIRDRGAGRDWRLWVLVGSTVAVAVADWVAQDAVLVGFLVVPLVASASLGRPWASAGLTTLSIGLAVWLGVTHSLDEYTFWRRLLVLLLAGLVTVAIAWQVRRWRQAIVAEREHYRLIAENASDVIVRIPAGGVIQWVSPSLPESLGWLPEDWIGTAMPDYVHPGDVSAGQAVNWPTPGVQRVRIRTRDGAFHWIETHTREYRGGDGRIDGVVVSFRIVDAEVGAQVELERRARVDDLTGLFKRDHVIDNLATAMARPRGPNDRCAILFCDLDNLKVVNDEYGHAAGDILLRGTAERLVAAMRASDTVARLGGDEFLVVLDGVSGLDQAERVAESLRAVTEQPLEADGVALRSSISIGITLVEPDDTVTSAIARADEAMYRAKLDGRNRVATGS